MPSTLQIQLSLFRFLPMLLRAGINAGAQGKPELHAENAPQPHLGALTPSLGFEAYIIAEGLLLSQARLGLTYWIRGH